MPDQCQIPLLLERSEMCSHPLRRWKTAPGCHNGKLLRHTLCSYIEFIGSRSGLWHLRGDVGISWCHMARDVPTNHRIPQECQKTVTLHRLGVVGVWSSPLPIPVFCRKFWTTQGHCRPTTIGQPILDVLRTPVSNAPTVRVITDHHMSKCMTPSRTEDMG